MTAELIPARLGHVLSLGRRLNCAWVIGDPRQAIARVFMTSWGCKALMVDGQPVAAYGLTGSMLSPEAQVWLLVSPGVRAHLQAFMAAYRAEFLRVAERGLRLSGFVAERDLIGMRFAARWGFRLEWAPDGMRRVILNDQNERAPKGPPFIIYGLPRSGTRWLAEMLTYRGWVCHHQPAIALRSIDDIATLFRQPRTGAAEPGAALGWRVLRHHAPDDLRVVVVRRPIEECVKSMCRVDTKGAGYYDAPHLRHVLAREARALDDIAAQPGVLSVDFHNLWQEAVCARVFEHCLPARFDRAWWNSLKDRNIQCDVPGTLRYFQENADGIMSFKRTCWRELRRLVYNDIVQRAA